MKNRMHWIAGAAVLALVAAASQAWAQVETPAAGSSRTLRLSVEEAVALALEHNLDLQAAQLAPQIGDTRVAQALSAYNPTLTTTFQRNDQVTPPTSFLVGQQGVTTEVFNSQVGVSQRLPWFGGAYSVAWDSSRTTSDSPFTNFNPSLGSRLNVSFSQPLLRNLTIDPARLQLVTTRRGRDISQLQYQETRAQTEADVRRAYWNLVSARASIGVARTSLDLAMELARNNRARVDVGQMAPLDLVAAEAEVAQRQEALIVAETAARQAEDRLRTLILDPESPDFWAVQLEPAEELPAIAPLPDFESAIATALRDRTDLERSRLEAENTETSVDYFENQRLPDVRFNLNSLRSGVGGSRLVRTGGFPGTVVDTVDTSFGSVLDQLFSSEFPTWTVGVTVSYPLGRSFEEANLAQARLELTQRRTRLESLELEVARQIREAGWAVEANAKRIEAARQGRELAEQRLDAEQKRFEVGMSTSFLVVQAQRDLAQARNNEVLAILAYEQSLIDFQALQRVPVQGGGSAAAAAGAGAGVPGSSAGAVSQLPVGLSGQQQTQTGGGGNFP